MIRGKAVMDVQSGTLIAALQEYFAARVMFGFCPLVRAIEPSPERPMGQGSGWFRVTLEEADKELIAQTLPESPPP